MTGDTQERHPPDKGGTAPGPQATRPPECIRVDAVCDTPTEDDVIGFRPYVRALARFLRSPGTKAPLTVSVEGEWGSGKSSFLCQLKNQLLAPAPDADTRGRDEDKGKDEDKGEPLFVQFDAWAHENSDQLWAAFALTFQAQVSRQLGWWATWCAEVRLTGRRCRWRAVAVHVLPRSAIALAALVVTLWLATLGWLELPELAKRLWPEESLWRDIAMVTGRLGDGALWLSATMAIWRRLNALFDDSVTLKVREFIRSPDYESHTGFLQQFQADFAKMVQAYAGERRIYVFIDDLDRCEVPKAADLMAALSVLLGGNPKLYFIIAMDREKVAASIASKHAKLLPYIGDSMTPEDPDRQESLLQAIRYGYDFIEKFIQIPFPLPRPQDADVEKLIGNVCEGREGAPDQHKG